MPGLTGFCGPNAPAVVDTMAGSLLHRSDYVQTRVVSEAKCALSRIDFGWTEAESYTHSDGDVSATVWGEVFNLPEIAKSRGLRARSGAELIGKVVRSEDAAAILAEIDGIFCAVVCDAVSQTVTLVTDRFGLKHLYHSASNGYVGFATEVKALLGLSGEEVQVSQESLDSFWRKGMLSGNRTWFENITLLPPATVTEICMTTSRVLSQATYWKPRSAEPDGSFEGDEDEACELLGKLFRQAVERRLPQGEFEIPLSGGLDSRAILAAVPEHRSVTATTFGQATSADYRIAKRVASFRGCEHQFIEISSRNWLDGRLAGIWWTDGHLNLVHMHGLGPQVAHPVERRVGLSGYLGGGILGGVYLDYYGSPLLDNIFGRGRRMIAEGLRLRDCFMDFRSRCPYLDNSLVDCVLTLPREWVAGSRIYHRMLLREFPQYYTTIPWQQTGYPISYAQPVAWILDKGNWAVRKFGGPVIRNVRDKNRMGNYAAWVRDGVGRELFEKVLFSKSALYPQFIPVEEVKRVWDAHLRGRNEAIRLASCVTIEIWLRQVIENRLRPNPDEPEFGLSSRQVLAVLG